VARPQMDMTLKVELGVAVQDGDTLVIAVERRLMSDELAAFRDRIREDLPSGVKVLIVEGAVGLARYRPDAD
jgi:hypothetical protein